VFGMIGGDANKDGVLKYSGPANDRGPVLQYIVNQSGSSSITTTVSGYRGEDMNMDNVIKYSGPGNDPSLIVQNLVGLTSSTSITSVYNSIVPHGITPFQCGDTLLDQRDGQKYTTVQIGSQCWMVENLAYLPSVSSSLYGSISSPYYYVHGYQGTSVSAAKATGTYKTYGVLYNWIAAMDGEASSDSVPSGVQGVCPDGWHLPADEEWKILEGAVDSQYGVGDPEWDGTEWRGSDGGGNLKETGTTHWNSPNTGATNNSGFIALPGGYRGSFGSLYPLGSYSYFWSSTEFNSSKVWYRRLSYANTNVGRNNGEKSPGISVKCCKDGS
ncbi:MAG: fibrobacter succinogenes major paralogous domain-containing protein, partial [Bacteroidales bacterium]|nr:fibrobacter succinogenes major paralogous domain-containing protein [Bacteroidales bacterium]